MPNRLQTVPLLSAIFKMIGHKQTTKQENLKTTRACRKFHQLQLVHISQETQSQMFRHIPKSNQTYPLNQLFKKKIANKNEVEEPRFLVYSVKEKNEK